MAQQRRLRDWSQLELARRIRRSQGFLSNLETGKATPTKQEAKLLSELLGIPPEDLQSPPGGAMTSVL